MISLIQHSLENLIGSLGLVAVRAWGAASEYGASVYPVAEDA